MEEKNVLNVVGGEKVLFKCKSVGSKMAVISLVACIVLAFVVVGSDCFLVGLSVISQFYGKGAFDVPVFLITLAVHVTSFIVWAIYALNKKRKRENTVYYITDVSLAELEEGEKNTISWRIVPLSAISAVNGGKKKVTITVGEHKLKLYTGAQTATAYLALDSAVKELQK